MVDHNCRELIHIIIENFFLKKTDILLPISRNTAYLTSNIVQNDLEKTGTVLADIHLLREYIQLSIENVEVENQIEVAPFPILLSQRRVVNKTTTPFLNMEVYLKNIVGKNTPNKIKYISSVNVFVGHLDMKIDDQTIQICIEMYKRLNLSKSRQELDEIRNDVIEKFKPVYLKLEAKENSTKNTSRIYIKRLNIEPIKILLTFRSASKSDQSTIANNFFADFGLIFASIKDANIELEGLKITHIFGTSDVLLKHVMGYYKSSVG